MAAPCRPHSPLLNIRVEIAASEVWSTFWQWTFNDIPACSLQSLKYVKCSELGLDIVANRNPFIFVISNMLPFPSTSFHVRRSSKIPPWTESESELYRPGDRPLSAKLVPTFVNRGCHKVSVTDPYGRNLGFRDRSRYFFFKVAPQLYSRGWVDPVSHPLLLRISGSAGIRTRTSGSVARNSDH
jgi:hypothetical protein